MTRKLASVRRVRDILPIEGADKICVAKIDGWQVVTQKGWCKPGDLVCYFEVDSFLPIRSEYEFLRKSGFKSHPDLGDGFRLKTIKLRGQLSQGLIMPLEEVLPHKMAWANPSETLSEGADLTEILGVKLYEKPLPRNLSGKVRGNFPSFIPKTDQERVQNIIGYLPEHLSRKYQATLKLDGSSMTIYARSTGLDGVVLGEFGAEPTSMVEVGVCSRNLDLKLDDETPSLFLRTFRELELETKLLRLQKRMGDISVQGEMMGPGIQGNRERLECLHFFVFDMFDIRNQEYLNPVDVERLCAEFGFDHVPVVDYIALADLWDDSDPVSRFLEIADRPSLNHDVAEGVVFKAIGGPRHSFKVVNNNFLLKEKD